MDKQTKLGFNRTGLQMSPIDAGELIQGTEPPDDPVQSPAARIRSAYARVAAEGQQGMGSVPVPGSLKGVLKAGVERLSGNRAEVLLDKLGERAAYERAGTRLYEAFLTRLDAFEGSVPESMQAIARTIRDQEMAHYLLVRDCIVELGGDPTAQTPGATAVGMQGIGLIQVMSDPRANLSQCLNVLLAAELIDTAAWELLAELAAHTGHDEMHRKFFDAGQIEAQHLVTVKRWCREIVLSEAGGSPRDEPPK